MLLSLIGVESYHWSSRRFAQEVDLTSAVPMFGRPFRANALSVFRKRIRVYGVTTYTGGFLPFPCVKFDGELAYAEITSAGDKRNIQSE